MVKVTVEYEGKKNVFEGDYVIAYALNVNDDNVDIEGINCGTASKAVITSALAETTKKILYSLIDLPIMRRGLSRLYINYLKEIFAEDSKEVEK